MRPRKERIIEEELEPGEVDHQIDEEFDDFQEHDTFILDRLEFSE